MSPKTTSHRVLARFLLPQRVATRKAKEFSSPEALREYLKEHPQADKSLHTVRKPEEGRSKPEEKGDVKAKPKSKFFSSGEMQGLGKEIKQKHNDPEKLFEVAHESHEYQLNWLNHGKGLDKAIGAKVVRGDKQEMPDYSEDGPMVIIGPIKSRKRVDEKVRADYGGDYSMIGDLVRASVAVDSMDQLEDVMAKLKKSGLKLASLPKDRFAEPTEAGYRDLMMKVEYPNGHVGELQLHLKPILKAKDAGHKYYEQVRAIEGKAKEEGRTTMTEEETQIVDEANRKQRDLYDQAWGQATRREKTAAMVRQAKATKFYEYDGLAAYWKRGEFPKIHVRGKKERPEYDLQKFFHEAIPLSEREYNDLRSGPDDEK